jgi:hypothetical protein
MDVMERNAFALTRGGEAVTTRVMAHQSVYDPNNRKKTRAVLQGMIKEKDNRYHSFLLQGHRRSRAQGVPERSTVEPQY